MKSWWERWPDRLEAELKALDKAGITYTRDPDAFAAGILKLCLRHDVNGEVLDLVAVFPDLYPYTAFQVSAPGLDLDRHQHPFGKNLCLIGRSTWKWHTTDTLADFVVNQVPRVLMTARAAPEVAATLEEPQGEPFSDYYPYMPKAFILVDSGWSLDPAVPGGHVELVIDIERVAHEGIKYPIIKGAVVAVSGPDGRELARMDPALAGRFGDRVTSNWVRVAHPIRQGDPFDVLAALGDPPVKETWKSFGMREVSVTGIVFPEEFQQGRYGDGWLFVIRWRRGRNKRPSGCFVRADRAGRVDLASRVPELARLSSKTVAVFGAGGIGAPAVIELARAQTGELRLVDHDRFDPATAVRWPLGLAVANQPKVEALRNHLRLHYPYTNVRTWVHRLGQVRDPGLPMLSDMRVLDEVLDGSDLIFDATAEIGIHNILSDAARERSMPYVYAHTTLGAWGGLVARVVPGRTEGCWLCLQYALHDGTIPEPASNPHGTVQPAGCADPTFTGAGFDVATVSLEAVRTMCGILCEGMPDGYPDADWDVATLSLRDKHGRRAPATWRTFGLARHQACPRCS